MESESDEDFSPLNLESKTFNKVRENTKSLGFQEGALKGKDISLQNGFDVGYSYGYKLGQEIGIIKGVLSFQSAFKGTSFDKDLESKIKKLSNQTCLLCPSNDAALSNEIYSKEFNELLELQEKHYNYILDTLTKK